MNIGVNKLECHQHGGGIENRKINVPYEYLGNYRNDWNDDQLDSN